MLLQYSVFLGALHILAWAPLGTETWQSSLGVLRSLAGALGCACVAWGQEVELTVAELQACELCRGRAAP